MLHNWLMLLTDVSHADWMWETPGCVIRENVACRMRQILVLEVSSTGKGSSDEEELVSIPTKKTAFKSGKLRTADSRVLHHIV